jgi:transcriptional regulator with XRE-family HTH domain
MVTEDNNRKAQQCQVTMTFFKVMIMYNGRTTDLAAQIGKRLKAAREEKRLTQEEMGTYLGIGRAGYANIETGRSLIGVDHLLKLPGKLHKPITYFLGDNGSLPLDEAELLELYKAIPPGPSRKVAFATLRALIEEVKETES